MSGKQIIVRRDGWISGGRGDTKTKITGEDSGKVGAPRSLKSE